MTKRTTTKALLAAVAIASALAAAGPASATGLGSCSDPAYASKNLFRCMMLNGG